MRPGRILLLALAATVFACGAPGEPIAGADAAADAGTDAVADLGPGDAHAGTDVGADVDPGACAPLRCVEPCAFSFRDIAPDRDGVVEARLAADRAPGRLIGLALVDVPTWVRFAAGMGDYLERVTGGTWSLSADGRAVVAAEPIPVPVGESLALLLRADDPGDARCAVGACGYLHAVVDDCAGGSDTVQLPLVR